MIRFKSFLHSSILIYIERFSPTGICYDRIYPTMIEYIKVYYNRREERGEGRI